MCGLTCAGPWGQQGGATTGDQNVEDDPDVVWQEFYFDALEDQLDLGYVDLAQQQHAMGQQAEAEQQQQQAGGWALAGVHPVNTAPLDPAKQVIEQSCHWCSYKALIDISHEGRVLLQG